MVVLDHHYCPIYIEITDRLKQLTRRFGDLLDSHTNCIQLVGNSSIVSKKVSGLYNTR
jgi:hypothetical protein